MRILLITNLYAPYGRGGAEIVVAQEARELRDAGHDVAVLTTCPFSGFSSLLPAATTEDGIRALRFYPLNIFWYRHDYKHSALVRFFWHLIDTINIHAWFMTRRVIKELRPDEIRTHNLKGIGVASAYAVHASARPWIHFLHDIQLITPSGLIYYHEQNAWKHQGFPVRAYRAICRTLIGSPAVVRAPSAWVWETHRVYAFFSKSRFEKVVWHAVTPILTEWHPHLPPRFLFVGQLAHHKGVMFLLDVLRELPSGSCTVHIVGDGPLLSDVAARAREVPWVQVHGRLSLARVKELLRDTDALLFPSLAFE